VYYGGNVTERYRPFQVTLPVALPQLAIAPVIPYIVYVMSKLDARDRVRRCHVHAYGTPGVTGYMLVSDVHRFISVL
jgi:hypothetical protein